MTIWITWALVGLYALIVVRWLAAHREFSIGQSHMLAPRLDPPVDLVFPSVSVIVAAHNEEAAIGRCLERILAQRYPHMDVIVANDRSTDRTAEIVASVAGRAPDIRRVDIDALPDGWLGKTHAVSVASRAAAGEYLVFADSDVEWEPGMLTTVMELMVSRRLDFLSLWPKLVVASFWERLLLPPLGWSMSMWFTHPDPNQIETTPAFANGQFLVMRRDAYERIGGHAAVPDEIAEDVALIRNALAAGQRCYLGFGANLFRTRMYENLRQIIAGWRRIYIGALSARWKLLATIPGIVLGCLLPFGLIAGLLPAAMAGSLGGMGWTLVTLSAVHIAAMYAFLHRLNRAGYEGGPYLWLFPVGALLALPLLTWCVLLASGIGTIPWGGVRFRVKGSRVVKSGQ